MTTSPPPEPSHPWRENLETASIAIVMALILKYFTLEAFQIPTGSMQPTLMGLDARVSAASGGRVVVRSEKIFDRILVDKLIPFFRDPRRYEIWVFLYPLDKSNRYIKRVVGLPGEELKIEYGDIKVRNASTEEWRVARKPDRVQESVWLNVFESGAEARGSQFWDVSGAQEQSGKLVINGKGGAQNRRTILDNYDDGYGATVKPLLVTSQHEPCVAKVRDLRLTLRAEPSAEHRKLALKLGWGGDALRAEIPGPSGDGKLRILFNERELASADARLQYNHKTHIEFWRADEAVALSLDGEIAARAEFESTNTPGENFVAFDSDGGLLTIHASAVDRDIYYTNMNGFQFTRVPPGHYFMLGDNSTASADGRAWMERTVELRSPLDGLTKLVGGTRTSGAASDWNPRTFRSPSAPPQQIFRNEFGEEYRFSDNARNVDIARQWVPRDHYLGRAFFVFWPWPPFAAAARIGVVR